MSETQMHPKIQNDVIRKQILDYYYEEWHKSSTKWISCYHLVEELHIPPELLLANIRYLVEKGLITNGGSSTSRPLYDIYQITSHGIDVIEHPDNFVSQLPFVQIFSGNVTGSTIINAQKIEVGGDFSNVYHQMSELNVTQEISEAIKAVEEETQKTEPNISRIKELMKTIKADDRIFSIVAPVVTEAMKKIVFGV